MADPNTPTATLAFVSSVQRGMSVGLTRQDDATATGGGLRAPLNVSLTFDTDHIAQPKLTLVGPGDIVGLDPRAIVRTYPRRDDNDAEFEHFVAIEFDQADLPWRYTPAKPKGDRKTSSDQLRPWFSLIVLIEGDEIKDDAVAPASLTQKLPILSVQRKFLPDQTELWAWAHLHVNERIDEPDPSKPAEGPIATAVEGLHGRVVARLMSPRILTSQKAYRAFLVPTFEASRLVGTGQSPAGMDGLTPAWIKPPDGDAAGDEVVKLPVYYDWRFQTGTAGSFESLISALVPTPVPDTVGQRQIDVHDPGLNLPAAAAAPLAVGGALQSVAAAAATAAEKDPDGNWVTALSNFVGVSEILAKDEDGVERLVKVVSPPLYARWYAAQDALSKPPPAPPTNPPWFYRLNSDPRYRVPAALGTEAVQREQQSLMDAAWRQIDQLRSANYERKVLQTAREALGRLMDRHLATGFLESKLALTARFQSRFLSGNGSTTFFDLFRRSPLPSAFLDLQWRRFSSPRGLLGRRLGLPKALQGQAPGILGSINDGTLRLAPTPPVPAGASVSDAVWGATVPGNLTDKQVSDLAQKLGKDGLVFWGLVLFWVGRRLLVDLRGQFWWLLHDLIRLGGSLIRLANDPQLIREKLRDGLRTGQLKLIQVTQAPQAPSDFKLTPNVNIFDPATAPGDPGPLPLPAVKESEMAGRFRQAVGDLVGYLGRDRTTTTLFPVDLQKVVDAIFAGIKPSVTLLESQKSRLHFTESAWKNLDQLEPIQAAPEFDRPMYQPLRDISNEWILPGLGDVKPDTIGLVVTNQRFVEAYMAGLNHEMTRELIWNEYPVDQRNTYFRQFWDARSFIDGPENTHSAEELKDINPIRDWPATNVLGKNSSRPAVTPNEQQVVLLVRGQLIKKYPNVIVYAATSPTRDPPPAGYKERHPVFQGFLGGDIAYYGFDLLLSDVKDADDPWYFILQEHPSEPRFHIPIPFPTGLLNARAGVEFDGNESAAAIADNAFHDPVRIAVKGSALVKPSSP